MKIGRNESCPCGSGKKYKKCCLNKSDFKQVKGVLIFLKKQQIWVCILIPLVQMSEGVKHSL